MLTGSLGSGAESRVVFGVVVAQEMHEALSRNGKTNFIVTTR